MKTKLFLLSIISGFLIACSAEEQTKQVNLTNRYINTENPLWIRNVYLSQQDDTKMAAFETNAMLLDLTFSSDGTFSEYWLSYYFTFDNDTNWSPIKNYTATDSLITYSVDNIYYEKELFFKIDRLQTDDINITVSDSLNSYNKGIFIKQ